MLAALAVFAGAVLVAVFGVAAPVSAANGINQQINFQGRLLNAQGATVADGYYNVQFNIYQDGTGTVAGNPGGTLEWTETYLNTNSQGVRVVNGFLSVQLGSITSLSGVDWNQDTLWLSMNIAGTNTSCTPFASCSPDGEMVPMKRMSANAYAMNAGNANMLGGLTSAGFIQNGTSVQASSNFNISGTGVAGTALQAPLLDTAAAGALSIGTTNATSVTIGKTGVVTSIAGGLSVLEGLDNNDGGITNAGAISGVSTLTTSGDINGQTISSTANFTGTLAVADDTTLSAELNLTGSEDGLVNFSGGASDWTAWLYGDIGGTQKFRINRNGSTSATSLSLFGTGDIINDPATFSVDTDGDVAADGTVTSGGNINTIGGVFQVNGTSGTAATCTGGQFLQDAVVTGGIVTGGTCVTFNGADGGVTAVGMLDDQSPKSADGAIIAGTSLYLQTADDTYAGLVSIDAQTFAGSKTFNDGLVIAGTGIDGGGHGITGAGAIAGVTTLTASGTVTGETLVATVADGTAPLTVTSTTKVVNLNVDLLDGLDSTAFAAASGSANYIQNTTTQQTADFNISGSGTIGGGASISGGLNNNGGGITNAGSIASATTISGSEATALSVQGGNATSGNVNGGNLNLSGGTGSGTGVNGLVVISTPTFSTTTNDANCFTGGALVATSCTVTAASVNNSASIIIGFSTGGRTATLPNPTNLTAGRIIYMTAANGSSDFTIEVNGGGVGNSIAMRQNTSATMIWNGSDWTAAGASSSTTLQSAYDNTLQSAGGAELIVSKTSTTNGLTIRDSSVNEVKGTLISVQSASAASLFSVNSNVTEYAKNAGAETAGGTTTTFPASSWAAVTGSTVSRNITSTNNSIATGQGSVSVVTAGSANSGVSNTLTTALTANSTYNVSFAARLSSGTFTDANVYYSVDGSAASVACASNQAIATSVWTKINCTFKAPASGVTSSNAILIRQTSATARTFYVDNLSVTIAADFNYAGDGSVNSAANFATNWQAVTGGGTVTASRDTSVGYDASDSAHAQISTVTAGAGLRNRLTINPLATTPGTLYRLTVYASSSSAMSDFTIRYSRDGGTNFVNCVDYNSQSLSGVSGDFKKISCYLTPDSTTATNPYVYFTQGAGAARSLYVDGFSMTLASDATPNVQIGSGTKGGPTTLFTLDKGASAPIASNNDALLGSMYYDTTLGKLQCYEADGWGACGSSPDNIVTISPEYTNAVLHGTGVGTMVSDICSDALNINDGSSSQPTICGSNETYNFYKWTSPQASAQNYSIYVTYQLPSTFKSFASGQTSIMGRTDSTNATVNYQIYRNDAAAGLVACGNPVSVSTGAASAWQTGIASGAADPSTCSFEAGNSILFKINLTASQNASAYVGNLNFTFSNR